MASVNDVLNQAERHADGRATETEMPVNPLRDIAGHNRAEDRA
jgi:hypothetical protein